MPLSRDEVLAVVRQDGPIIPNDIRKRLGQPDSTLIGVYLSDLQNDGSVRRTSVKLGSSSFYYVPEQRERVASLAAHLNEKERRVAGRLREGLVLRVAAQDPLTRVALTNMPDFAVPLQVRTAAGEETFYRWFLASAEEVKERIRGLVQGQREEESAPIEQERERPRSEPDAAEPEERRDEAQAAAKPRTRPDRRAQQRTLADPPDSAFAKQLLAYFSDKGIAVESIEEMRKDSDIEAVIHLPTAVGTVSYFCKAKNKKKSNDGDLAGAILAARKHMLPAMFLTTGTVTQKAKESPELRDILVVEIGRSD